MIQIFVLILGLIMGSFLGVVIDRLPKKISISTGRSRCEFCNRDLTPLELIPLVSYFIQKGKCKKCHTKLSLRYPLLELITGITYVLVYVTFGYTIQSIIAMTFASVLIVIAFIDIDTMLIFDRFHIIILILAFIDAILLKKPITDVVFGALIISVPLLIIANITGGIGGGDIKLMFASGAYLATKNIVVAFVIAVIIGGIYGVITLMNKKHDRKDAIPFGPFLCVGLFISLLYGQNIANWYIGLLFAYPTTCYFFI